MKLVIATMFLALPFTALAGASATLGVTSKISVTIENQTDLKFDRADLAGHFSCWTNHANDNGEPDATISEADTGFISDSHVVNATTIEANIQNTKAAHAEAPAKQKTVVQECAARTALKLHTQQGETLVFNTPIAQAVVTNASADLTSEFEEKTAGQYIVKLVDAGLSINPQTGEKDIMCYVGLFKKDGTQLISKGIATKYLVGNCAP